MVWRGPTKQEQSLPHHHHSLASPGVRGQSSGGQLGPGPGESVQHPEVVLVLLGATESNGWSLTDQSTVSYPLYPPNMRSFPWLRPTAL